MVLKDLKTIVEHFLPGNTSLEKKYTSNAGNSFLMVSLLLKGNSEIIVVHLGSLVELFFITVFSNSSQKVIRQPSHMNDLKQVCVSLSVP